MLYFGIEPQSMCRISHFFTLSRRNFSFFSQSGGTTSVDGSASPDTAPVATTAATTRPGGYRSG